MSFSRTVTLHVNTTKKGVLPTREMYRSQKIKKHIDNQFCMQQSSEIHGERASDSISYEAGLTVEAAMILPLFLFAVYMLWLFFSVLTVQVEIQAAAEAVTGQLAQQTYLLEEWKSGTEDDGAKSELASRSEGLSMESMLSEAAWKLYAGNQLVSNVGRERLNQSPIVSGAGGVSVLRSVWHHDGDLELKIDYLVEMPILLGITWKVPMTQHSIRRCWTGSQSRESGDQGESEEMVYITASGSVYHRDISCYHLTLTVREVAAASVSGKRNNKGEAYTPCERCTVAVAAGSTVFIAKEGNRYHTTRDCAGLKRSIETVPLSQAGGRRACSNCGS